MAKIILMAMALRRESFNKKFIVNADRLVRTIAPAGPVSAELLTFNEYPMPVYDGTLEAESGVPAPVQALAAKIRDADALILSTPEYNGSIPGPFKNAIDWVSRVKPMPWAGKHVLLLGASPGALGAVRGLWHARVPLEVCGAHVFPEMLGLPQADQAFDGNGRLKEAAMEERLSKLLQKYLMHVTG